MWWHKWLSWHYWRLHVFTGGEQSEYAKYMVFSFDRETWQSEQVWYWAADYIEPRFSDDKPIFYSRTDGKKAAMKKAAQYNCLDIIDENWYLKKEEYDKRLR